MSLLNCFHEIWCVDYEFQQPDGDRPRPICVVAHEIKSGRNIQLWEEELHRSEPPYAIGKDSVFVAYLASAEFGCHLALGWALPTHTLDLYVEYSRLTNGLDRPYGRGLLGALQYFGITGIDAGEKAEMRALAMRGGPWSAVERQALLAYCESDVIALTRLLPVLELYLTPQALLRGSYMQAVAQMEWTGVPLDTVTLTAVRHYWGDVKKRLIDRVDGQYGVYDDYQFKNDLFEAWLIARHIPWPQTKTGRLDTQADTFREMALLYPCLRPLAELKATTGKMMLTGLAVGADGYNRTLLSPFQAKTGRNQPSTTKFIFGPATWIRSYIRPRPGYGLAYIDWGSQEFGIAAILSGDHAMIEAYESGDCYLTFAKQANAVPEDATKASHGAERELFKQCVLATQYGMSSFGLAKRISRPVCTARYILDRHYRTYKTFWKWSDAVVAHAGLYNQVHTRFGWTLNIGPTTEKQQLPFNPRSLRNFPMQATGAEMLRLACLFATQSRIAICAPIHDALLIQAPLEHLEHAVAETQRCMAKASAVVLDGFELRTEVKIIRYPDRYRDERGVEMWQIIWGILSEIAPEVVCETAP